MLYTYAETAHVLGYPSYDAVRMAVRRGRLEAKPRPGDRRKFIPRAEILRVLRVMGLSIAVADRIPETVPT